MKISKVILLLFCTSGLFVSCREGIKGNLTDLPIVNNVAELIEDNATAMPLTDNKVFLVSGKVKSNIYFFGQGCIELADLQDETKVIYLLTKEQHKVGDKLTTSVTKKPIISINDDAIEVYVES